MCAAASVGWCLRASSNSLIASWQRPDGKPQLAQSYASQWVRAVQADGMNVSALRLIVAAGGLRAWPSATQAVTICGAAATAARAILTAASDWPLASATSVMPTSACG